MTPPETALIALGANLPWQDSPPERTLARALAALATGPLRLRAVSRFFRTPCFPPGAGPDYVNAALACTVPAGMRAGEVLAELHRVEAMFGRARDTRWGMRTLDLDLIALGAQVAPDAATQTLWSDLPPDLQRQRAPETLILPHPRLQDRGFVLLPLAEIAPRWRHPLFGRSIAEMAADLAPEARRDIAAL